MSAIDGHHDTPNRDPSTAMLCPEPLCSSPSEGLQELFGFREFRPGQRAAIDSVLAGRDALVVMPTGSGKSLCYQLAGFATEGIALVISPLIALMKDQVDALDELDLPVTYINSALGSAEQRRRIEAMERGDYKLVYVAPERFASERFATAIDTLEVGLLAVDEAHCVSQWGHDFRPDYLRLAEIRRQLDEPPTLALTATATRFVQRDIVEQLQMPEADIQVSGFERPNLSFEVCRLSGHAAKIRRIRKVIDHWAGESVVVYCATRKQTENVAEQLQADGVEARAYHAGKSNRHRRRAQEAWMRGEVPVLAATNAFGMGVDKPDVRAIVHYHLPGSVEAYYQEAGRAGRDGEPANCVLLYDPQDIGLHDWFRENSYPERKSVERLWNLLRQTDDSAPFDPEEAAQVLGHLGDRVHSMAVNSCVRLLEGADHLRSVGGHRGQPRRVLVDEPVEPEELRVDWEELARRRELAQKQLDEIVAYAETDGCKQAGLLEYFGSEPSFGARCGVCDACAGAPDYAVEADAEVTIPCDEPPRRLVRKLLSGIARAGRDWSWGTHAIAAMLRGSEGEKVRRGGLQHLSTHGILEGLSQTELVYLLKRLLEHGLAERDEHDGVVLTEAGRLVMCGDRELPERLESFLDDTLVPADETVPWKERVGNDKPLAPTQRTTLKQAQRGWSPERIADVRDLALSTVLKHLTELAARGEDFDMETHVDRRWMEKLRELAGDWRPGEAIRPLKDAMPDRMSYPELKLHLVQLLLERRGATSLQRDSATGARRS